MSRDSRDNAAAGGEERQEGVKAGRRAPAPALSLPPCTTLLPVHARPGTCLADPQGSVLAKASKRLKKRKPRLELLGVGKQTCVDRFFHPKCSIVESRMDGKGQQ